MTQGGGLGKYKKSLSEKTEVVKKGGRGGVWIFWQKVKKNSFFLCLPLGKTSFKGGTEIVRGLTPLPRGLNRRDFSEKLVQQSYRKWGVPPAPFNVCCQFCRKGRCLPKKNTGLGASHQWISLTEMRGTPSPPLKGRWDAEEQGSLLFPKMEFIFYKSSY